MKRFVTLLYLVFLTSLSFSVFSGGISGSTAVCIRGNETCNGYTGTFVTYTAVGFSNPTYYRWITTGGVFSPHSPLTNSFTVFFPNTLANGATGTIRLETSEGNATMNFVVFKPAGAAGNIIGEKFIDTSGDPNITYTYYTTPIQNASSVIWAAPSGSSIVSQSNTSIVLKFSSSFLGGTLRVFGVNGPCGAGLESTIDIDGQKEVVSPLATYTPSSSLPNITERLLTSNQVGSSPGVVNVGTSGAATYDFPITIAPGTAGLVPELSVFYNSQLGVGQLGKAWFLNATSSIIRTGKNYFIDGAVGSVGFNSEDRFSLDGNRLLAYSGTYGSNNAEYRTETESFRKVVSYGQSGSGPTYFIVENKDGTVYEYGRTNDSRIEEQNSESVSVWYLNKIIDKYGNYIKYNYYEYRPLGESRLLSIEYTGNASLSPYNKVDFSYVTITDPQKSYVGGSLVTNRVALDKIIVKADNSIVKEYHFKYTYDQGTRLSEIIEKDFAGNQFNSTIIDWGKSQISVAKRDADPFINGSFCFYYGDFNGDGRMDRVDDVYENMTYSLKLFHYSGQQNLFNHIATYNNQPSRRYEVVDINRDGKDDLIEIIPTSGNSYNYRILLSNGNGFNYMNLFNSGSLFSNTGGPHEMGIGDFDGDGVIDILFIKIDLNQNKLWEIFSFDANNPTGLEKRYAGNNFPNKPGEECTYSAAGGQYKKVCHPIYSLVNHVLFDYNGDGKTDILYFDKNGVARVLEFSLTGFTDVLFTSNLKEEEFKFFSDVNSDGLIDLVSKNDIYLSTGKGFVKCNDLVAEEKGDFNGDGKIDGIYIANENGVYNYYIKHNLGGSFSEPVKIASDVNSCGILKVADFNGDGIDDVFYWTSNPLRTGILYISNTNKNQFVSSITDGFNNTTFFEYKPLTDNSVYTKESGSLFPFMDYVGPFYVVSQMKVNNGIGGYNTFRYKYSGLRTHLQGRGSLGFKKTSIENLDNQTIVENIFDIQSKFVFPYLKQREIKLTSGNLIVRTDYSMSLKELGGKRFFPYLSQQITSNYLNNTSDNTTYKYDDNGNVLEALTDHSGEGITKITTTYTNGGTWLPSKPLKITVVKSVSGDVPFTQITDFTYNSFGKVLTQSNGAGTGKIVTTSFQYNNFGLPTRVTVSGTDVAGSRSVDYEYDTKGRFQIKSTNALGHISSATFDNKTGNILTSTDINGFITRFEYDGFGRCLRTILPDGNIVLNTLNWSDSSAPQYAVYCQTTQSTSAPAEKIYYDRLGRDLQKVNVGFNGDNIYSEVRYNSKKQIEWEIEPHYTNTIDKITRNYSYDQFGRINFISGPLEVKKITYNGRTVISSKENTSPKQTFSQTFNAFGQVVSVTDAGGTINYIYNSQGKVKKVISPGNLITLMEYDSFGNQIKISEPNAGTIDYTYNAFGELLTQIKNGNTSSITYDALGRVLTLTEQEGSTNYTYDTRTKGKGKVSSILHSSGTGENYYYDVLGRLSSKTEVIEGKQYTESIQYNSYGLPSSLTYPSGFCVAYSYNSNFYLTEVTRADNNTSIWKAEKMNPIGQLEQFKLGNNLTTKQVYNFGFLTGIQTGSIQNLSYEWDRPTGNLKMRKDVKRGLTERFNYDQLDRLTLAAIEGGSEMNFTYENNGNISYNSGAGNYVYDPIKLNAVTEIANPQGTISTTDQTAEYTTFDKIKKLTEGSKSAIISYGVNKERIKMTFTEGPTTKNRIYTHGNYEEESGVVERKIHYIATGSGVSALFIITNSGGMMYYLHKDHLGSIDVITNAAGEIVEEQSFDVWGRRRNPNNWTYENIASSSLIDRGYTGHEHLDQFGIINMNGRIYDPGIGRFLSPDKYVQAPQFTQSFNRFSYCFNNPLKYTDPSGWFGQSSTPGCGEQSDYSRIGLSNSDRAWMRWQYAPVTGYSYNSNSSLYVDNYGNPASFAEVHSFILKSGGVLFYLGGEEAQNAFKDGLIRIGRDIGGWTAWIIGSHYYATHSTYGVQTIYNWNNPATGVPSGQGGGQISMDASHNRIGFVPLDVGPNYGAYQMANYRSNISVRGNQNQITVRATSSNTPVSGGQVVFGARASLVVNGNITQSQVLANGLAVFKLPDSQNVTLTVNGGWTVRYDYGGAAVPVFHPLFWPFSLNFKDIFKLK